MTDPELLAWAQANPKSAQAAKILAKLGPQSSGQMGPFPANATSEVTNPALGPPSKPIAVQGGPQDPETGLDQGQLAQTNTPGVAKAQGIGLGAMLGGVSGAIPGMGAVAGGALTNMLTGYLGRQVDNKPTGGGNVAMDAVTGAIPMAALRGVGAGAAAAGMPKLAGYGQGATTADAAAGAGPTLGRVPDPALKFLTRQQDPAGAVKLAGMMGKQGTQTAEDAMASGGLPPSKMLDASAQLERYAQPAGIKSMVRGYMGGMINSPMHASFGVGPTANMTEQARYLSMMAQAAQRGIPLSPEMEAALKAMPGQTQAPSALGAASGAYGADR